jgi:hypothetical protein
LLAVVVAVVTAQEYPVRPAPRKRRFVDAPPRDGPPAIAAWQPAAPPR